MSPSIQTPERSQSPARQAWVMAALLAVVVAAAVMVWATSGAPPARAERDSPLAESLDRLLQRGDAALPPGVAVRPLHAADTDPNAQAWAAPVCDALVARLARLPGLRVASCGSTRVAMAANLDDRALARLLAVDHVLRGSVASAPEGRLRVRLALHDAGSDREHWQLDEEIAPAGVQALPAAVALRTGAALGIAYEAPALQTLDAALYQRFEGAQRLARRPSIADRRAALAEIEAVLLDAPDYSPAQYLRLGLISRLGMVADPADAGASEQDLMARQAAMLTEIRALGEALLLKDPGDWRAHVLLLNDAVQGGRWVQAFDRLDGLLQHVHRHPGMLRIAARLHVYAGYLGRARDLALQAARLDALDAEAHEVLAELHGMAGDTAAMQEFTAVARSVGHRHTGRLQTLAALRARDWNAVAAAMTDWLAAEQRDASWVPAYAQALQDPSLREAMAQQLDGHDEALRTAMSGYFLEYALLGDTARSLRAVQHHARLPPAAWLEQLWWPELSAVRQSPGFAMAMQDLGVTALWRERGAPDLCDPLPDGRWVCR